MVLADFTVKVHYDEQPRAVRVIVYDSLKGLRIAASRYDNATRRRNRRRRGEFTETLGICHRFEWINAETLVSDPLCAIVRLAEPHLGIGVVSHELAHAAVWLRELAESDGEAAAPPLTCANDEQFCWTLGELVRATVSVLIGRGVYER